MVVEYEGDEGRFRLMHVADTAPGDPTGAINLVLVLEYCDGGEGDAHALVELMHTTRPLVCLQPTPNSRIRQSPSLIPPTAPHSRISNRAIVQLHHRMTPATRSHHFHP